MQLKDIMTHEVFTVPAEAPLQEAARMMHRLDVGMLPVVEKGEVVGTVTDRDIAIRGIADGLDPSDHLVQDVMTPDVVFCYADQGIEDAAHVMTEERVRRLLILNRDGEPVGVLSLGDIALAAGDRNLGAQILVALARTAA